MGDAENGVPPPASTNTSDVTYQANIATVQVKNEGDASAADPPKVSPTTGRKQKNGILKKTTTRNPAGTALTLAVPVSDCVGGDDSSGTAVVDADKHDIVNNNNTDLETPNQSLVAAPDRAPAEEGVANGSVVLSEAEDADGAHNKKVSWSAETVVYTSRVDGGQRARPMNGRPPVLTNDGQLDRVQRPLPLDQLARSEKTTQKCCVIIAVKMLIIAIVGLIVLGVMYALR